MKSGTAAGRRRRWLRRIVLAAVLLPLLLFGLSNLWLATPPGRSWIAGKVTRSIGLPARIGPASWLPWDGLCLREIVVDRPAELAGAGAEPVLTVGRVKVVPHWGELARGRVSVGRIEVEEPALDLPVELLAFLVAAQPAPALPPAEAPSPEPSPEQVAGTDPEVQQPAVLPEEQETATGAAPQAVVQLPETSWMAVNGGSIRVRSAAGGGDWLAVAQIDAELPLRGEAADGVVAMKGIALAGWEAEALELPLRWEAPRISVSDWEPGELAVKLRVNAQCIAFGSMPFVIDCRLPEQAVDGQAAGLPLSPFAERAVGYATLAGHLRIPSTIAGRGGIEAEEVVVPPGPASEEALEFDNCRLWWQASGGVARVIDARAVGDQISLLGNAALVADGRIGGVVRVVAPQDAVAGMREMLGGLIGEPPAGFRPLETPDRWFVDCTLSGTIGDELFQVGDGPWRPVSEAAPMLRGLLGSEAAQ